VFGVKTTIPYHLAILHAEDFRKASFDTSFVEQHPELVQYSTRRPTREIAAVIAAALAAHHGL
jgi:pyruvate carboxylase subunit A